MRRLSASPIFLCLACLCVTACLRPHEDPWRLYTLSALPNARQAMTDSSTERVQLSIGAGPIHLPEYLDQDQIVSRISENRFALSEADRWAEPLAHNIETVLVENLSILFQADEIAVRPWAGRQQSNYQLEIEVTQFESDTTGAAHLAARYFLRDGATGRTIATKEERLSETARDRSTEQSVASLSKALGDFSVRIATDIREHLGPVRAAQSSR